MFDAVALDYDVTVVTDAASAETMEIAEANIIDMRNIGVRCLPLSEFQRLLTTGWNKSDQGWPDNKNLDIQWLHG